MTVTGATEGRLDGVSSSFGDFSLFAYDIPTFSIRFLFASDLCLLKPSANKPRSASPTSLLVTTPAIHSSTIEESTDGRLEYPLDGVRLLAMECKTDF